MKKVTFTVSSPKKGSVLPLIKEINKKIRKLNKQNHNLRIEIRRLKKNGIKEGDINW